MINSYKTLFLLIAFALFSLNCFSEKTIKVLAIGNSFSVDAAEAYLDDIAKEAKVNMIIGNCNLGGCSLLRHWQLAKGDSALYAFRKITNGDSILLFNQSLQQCLQSEDWDIVSLQQVSHDAGLLTSYFPYIIDLMEYIRKNSRNKNVSFALHQTWAYDEHSTHSGFKNYQSNQLAMYKAVTNTVIKVAERVGIKTIIPSGTAIQNLRSTPIDGLICRDGFHLSYGLGRYTAACVWFETLTGKSIIDISYKPQIVSPSDALKARQAAHCAVKNPFIVSSMHSFTE